MDLDYSEAFEIIKNQQYKPPKNPYKGQVFYSVIADNLFTYDGSIWTYTPDNRPRIIHCKTCGAALHGYKCDYCGVEYY